MRSSKKSSSATLLTKTGLWVGGLSLLLYLSVNIAVSQMISPLYFQMTKDERSAVVPFLVSVKPQSVFGQRLATYKRLYGEGIEQEVFEEETRRNALITSQLEILKRNPRSKEALYNLYLLYKDRGDSAAADAYLKRAQEIDPTVAQ